MALGPQKDRNMLDLGDRADLGPLSYMWNTCGIPEFVHHPNHTWKWLDNYMDLRQVLLQNFCMMVSDGFGPLPSGR